MPSFLEPIVVSGSNVDLSKRYIQSATVAASPAAAAETTICTLTVSANLSVVTGIMLWGWAAFTVGTSGTACTLKIRQTNTSGATICSTGATTGGIAATNLVDMNVQGLDAASVLPGQVYVLTLTVTGGAASSTVSACQLAGLIL